jgi:hypothetical protein
MRRFIALTAIAATIIVTGCSRTADTEVLGEQVTRPSSTTTTVYEEPSYGDEYEDDYGDSDLERLTYLVPEFEDVPFSELRDFLVLVCDQIDETDGDFFAVGTVVVETSAGYFDLDYSDAGNIVAIAVKTECPEWTDAAVEFANS